MTVNFKLEIFEDVKDQSNFSIKFYKNLKVRYSQAADIRALNFK